MEWSNEIVHKSAFNVTKKDFIKSMHNDPKIDLIQALGFEISLDEFLQQKHDILFTAINMDTKSESIAYLLQNSNSLQEYTLFLIAFSINLYKTNII